MDKAAKCLHRLFEIAPSKKRNFILDQVLFSFSANKSVKSLNVNQNLVIIYLKNKFKVFFYCNKENVPNTRLVSC